MLSEFTREAVFEQSYFTLLFVQRRQQMPSDKSRFTIADRARDDNHAAVVWEGVGELLWHPPFIRSQRAAAGVSSQTWASGFELSRKTVIALSAHSFGLILREQSRAWHS